MSTFTLSSMIFAALLALAPSAFGDDLATWQSKAQIGVSSLQKAELWVGGAVGVYDEGHTSVVFSGTANVGGQQKPDSSSIFEIGSLTKSFTGILLASVIADHVGLSVNDSVSKFLPELAETFAGRITLRQLATHTSGLPRLPCLDVKTSYCFHPADPTNPYADYSAAQLIAYLKSFSRPDAGPYEVDYSNTGAATLGFVLTRIENKSFEKLLTSRITAPLSMANTQVERVGGAKPLTLLTGYDIDRSEAKHWEWDVFAPTGGILSTTDDMMKFLAANVNPPESPLGRAIQLSQTLGLGWDSSPGAYFIWKNGQTAGFHSIMIVSPKKRTGIFVLSNIGSSTTDSVATMPFNAPMPDLMGPTLSDSTLQNFVGSYTCPKEWGTIQLTKPSSFLFLQSDVMKLRLRPVTSTEFNGFDGLNEDGYHKLTFEKSNGVDVSALIIHFSNGKVITDISCTKH